MADKARRALAAGHCAIVDAVFARPEERLLKQQSAAVLGVPFCGLFLAADSAMRIARVGMRGHDASDADAVARAARKPMISARSHGRASMLPARRTRRSPARGRCCGVETTITAGVRATYREWLY